MSETVAKPLAGYELEINENLLPDKDSTRRIDAFWFTKGEDDEHIESRVVASVESREVTLHGVPRTEINIFAAQVNPAEGQSISTRFFVSDGLMHIVPDLVRAVAGSVIEEKED